jgi:hypothetical protein
MDLGTTDTEGSVISFSSVPGRSYLSVGGRFCAIVRSESVPVRRARRITVNAAAGRLAEVSTAIVAGGECHSTDETFRDWPTLLRRS